MADTLINRFASRPELGLSTISWVCKEEKDTGRPVRHGKDFFLIEGRKELDLQIFSKEGCLFLVNTHRCFSHLRPIWNTCLLTSAIQNLYHDG